MSIGNPKIPNFGIEGSGMKRAKKHCILKKERPMGRQVSFLHNFGHLLCLTLSFITFSWFMSWISLASTDVASCEWTQALWVEAAFNPFCFSCSLYPFFSFRQSGFPQKLKNEPVCQRAQVFFLIKQNILKGTEVEGKQGKEEWALEWRKWKAQ